jgi:hypothetical protein
MKLYNTILLTFIETKNIHTRLDLRNKYTRIILVTFNSMSIATLKKVKGLSKGYLILQYCFQ